MPEDAVLNVVPIGRQRRADSDILPMNDGHSFEGMLAFEGVLADIAARLASTPNDQLLGEIESALRDLLVILSLNRSSVGMFDANGALQILCSVGLAGAEPIPCGPAPPFMQWYVNQAKAGRTIVIRSLDELPPEAEGVVRLFRRSGLQSKIGVPLKVGGQVVGVIGFGAFHPYRSLPNDLLVRLKLLGDVLAQALARKRSDDELAAARAEIKQLKERLDAENRLLQDTARIQTPSGLTSRSSRYQMVIEEIGHVAPTGSTVLLLGETGSGKEVLAQAIHNSSDRKHRPMIKVNCAALPATLIEAELFGREKGAFTGALARQAGRFELANGATIFLDEIGELPLDLQPKLLRVLQEGEFERVGGTQTIKIDARLIAATNRDLGEAVLAGRFREDLFYRLNVFPIEVPPLRDRREDIPLLTWTFVKEFSKSMGKRIEAIADESMAALQAYPWPGNVRELRNVIERSMILERTATLRVTIGRTPMIAARVASSARTLEESERAHILQTLERTGWRIRGAGGAAELLSIKPTTLESRMKKLGLHRPE